eukprot:Lithocolla_globosa_v1_NODE_1457_length_2560_cov_11.282635.p3 type:complete len:158 gc:universal NODE_1457_length_2560_cov_11.282635:803-1276(+)
MTTGMSAPPMDAVICRPNNPLMVVPVARVVAERVGLEDATNPSKETAEIPPIAMLIWSLLANCMGFEDIFSANLRLAITDPVVVMAPIQAPIYSDVAWNESMFCPWIRKSPTDVAVAAIPTSEWKAATASGREVGEMRCAICHPANPPIPLEITSCV